MSSSGNGRGIARQGVRATANTGRSEEAEGRPAGLGSGGNWGGLFQMEVCWGGGGVGGRGGFWLQQAVAGAVSVGRGGVGTVASLAEVGLAGLPSGCGARVPARAPGSVFREVSAARPHRHRAVDVFCGARRG